MRKAMVVTLIGTLLMGSLTGCGDSQSVETTQEQAAAESSGKSGGTVTWWT